MIDEDQANVTRRTLLKAGAGGAIGGLVAPHCVNTSAAEGRDVQPNVYQTLGVKRIVNAAGTITSLGGSLMPPEVVEAWIAASQSFVSLFELQDRVGERIAKLLGIDAAMGFNLMKNESSSNG